MNNAGRAIFWGGFWCGVLDITSAIVAFGIAFGTSPMRIFRSVAGGLLGREQAAHGGVGVAALGLACHFLIAFGAAAAYWLVSRKFRFLVEKPILAGLLYGEVVFLFMHLVVLPLSAYHAPLNDWMTLKPWPVLITGLVGHPFCVGLPIALAASKYSGRGETLVSAER
ncbi:MAG TPA: hypothetical protein VFP40_13735 [Terriglobales bacterium]|nr:hypothetical protein [Terriglobales bacterium]